MSLIFLQMSLITNLIKLCKKKNICKQLWDCVHILLWCALTLRLSYGLFLECLTLSHNILFKYKNKFKNGYYINHYTGISSSKSKIYCWFSYCYAFQTAISYMFTFSLCRQIPGCLVLVSRSKIMSNIKKGLCPSLRGIYQKCQFSKSWACPG